MIRHKFLVVFWVSIVVFNLVGCGQHQEVIEVSDRVRFVQYYDYQDRRQGLYSPVPIRQVIEVDGQSHDMQTLGNSIVRVFDSCGDVLLVTISNYGRFLWLLDEEGRGVHPLCDLLETHDHSIADINCTKEGRTIYLHISHRYTDNEHMERMGTIEKKIDVVPIF